MNKEISVQTGRGIVHGFMHYTVSFFCVIGIFFILKLGVLLIQLLAMVLIPPVAQVLVSFGILFLVGAAVIAYRSTKALNRMESKKRKNWIRVLILIGGIVAMVLSTVIIQISKEKEIGPLALSRTIGSTNAFFFSL